MNTEPDPEPEALDPAPGSRAARGSSSALATVITVYDKGPLIVRGPFTLQSDDQQEIDPHRDVVALCRCGRSRVKPFCDGTHALGAGRS
jgi:iron-binding CDGSH zinc finger protein